MSLQLNKDNGKHKQGRDISAMPFGVGEYPGYLLDFFNWGAFSQPFLWGVIYGVWPIVLALLAADVIPYALSYAFFNAAPESVKVLFYSLIVQLLCTTVARLYAGMNANKFVWTREEMVVKMLRDGQPRWDMQRYLSRQLNWKRYGMAFYVAGSVASGYVYYTALGSASQDALSFALVFPIMWLLASLAAARWVAKQAKVQMNATGLVSDQTSDFYESLQREPVGFIQGPHVKLNNNQNIPAIGFGTYKITDADEAYASVRTALEVGYRLIDTASFYENEEAVGRAIRESQIARNEIFITSKLWQDQQGYAGTVLACEETLSKLGVDYLDLYLVHWPVQSKLASTWKALEHLMIAGKIRSIGVCNFEINHLDELLKTAHIKPAINQIEMHPEFSRNDVVDYCKEKGIAVEAWAPLARGAVFENETLIEIGKAHEKTAGQVALRWLYQKGIISLPKSVHPERIAENFAIFDFELSDEEMARIDELDAGRRLGPNPQTFSWEWPKSSRN